MKPITLDHLRSCLAELNDRFPRPGMAALVEEFLIARLNPPLCGIGRTEPVAFQPKT